MPEAPPLSADALRLPDPEGAVETIVEGVRREVRGFRRKGAVVGLSGGIDSTVVATLAARAFGPEHVLGVLMPEADSAPDTLSLSRLAAESAGIETVLEDITPLLEASGCYRRRDEAIRPRAPGVRRRAGRRSWCCRAWSTPIATASSRWSPKRRTAGNAAPGCRRRSTSRWWPPPTSSSAAAR